MNEKQIFKKIVSLSPQIDTPALVIDHTRLLTNIRKMQKLANDASVQLRPHTKTHKSVYIAREQIKEGATGITVAKLGEAEVMFQAGIKNIFIANQITHPLKLQRLFILYNKATIAVGIDNIQQINILRKIFTNENHPLSVLIEIDSGFHRCGVEPGIRLIDIAESISKEPGLVLKGIFTHAGHVYNAKSLSEIQKIGTAEGQIMQTAVDMLTSHGMEIETVSVGATPTVKYSLKNSVITEIRPGNYVFYDNIQLDLGSCKLSECSLYILATVISQPGDHRIVIDAGSKSLSLDLGGHGSQINDSYGKLLNVNGKIAQLSEEHGIIHLTNPMNIDIGSPVLILPNHACAVTNLFPQYYLFENNKIKKKINIDARGKSQ